MWGLLSREAGKTGVGVTVAVTVVSWQTKSEIRNVGMKEPS